MQGLFYSGILKPVSNILAYFFNYIISIIVLLAFPDLHWDMGCREIVKVLAQYQ
jgi:hypothetical protein